jgi:hypothetical protein
LQQVGVHRGQGVEAAVAATGLAEAGSCSQLLHNAIFTQSLQKLR